MKYRSIFAILFAALLLGAGCSTGPETAGYRYDFPAESPASRTLEAWFDQSEEVDYSAPLDQMAPIEQVFSVAEVAYWDGAVERAGELYLRMLQREPDHALSRFAASRLYGLRDELVDYHRRLEPVLADIEFGQVEPLTAVYLSLIGQQVGWHQWNISETEAPFAADPDADAPVSAHELGFPARWMTTPVLSHWRLLDFDREFAPETQPALADEYLSPYVAEDRPVNYERSRPYIPGGVNLSPDFERSGVHYMETFATVEPGGDAEANAGGTRSFWLYTNFSAGARVWIDGEEVISRPEDGYGTSKRLRRVELSPGEHRILVKVAHQRGYRDWFDFALLADDATAVGGSGLTFSETPTADPDAPQVGITLASDQVRPAELEPLMIAPDRVAEAGDAELFLTAAAAYMDLEPEYFDAAFDELMQRHEDFAPGYILRALHTRTLWEVPSRIRNSRTLADIRRAHKLDPTNLDAAVRLIERLREQGSNDREIRQLLETARQGAVGEDGQLRNVEPLIEWADWLGEQGWEEAAEKAWREVVDAAPTHCRAAGELQQLYYRRGHFPELETITPEHQRCPSLGEKLAFERDDMPEERLAVYRKRARRDPYNAGAQSNYAEELVAQGRRGEAREVLSAARDRMPWELRIWNDLANQALADRGKDAAIAILQEAMDQNENAGWLQWRMSVLDNDLPLEEVMHDGLEAARAELARADAHGEDYAGDEAYYTLDFAARKYFEDGSSVTLTHTLVRVLTKNAIDRFGEFSPPGGARLLLARTVKADGTTREPEETAGKSTLSLPGLAPGDFVETAYVQYSPPESLSKTHREGMRFFFRMDSISSLHSEYLILGTDGEFLRMNDAPEAERVQTPAGDGVRFVRTDSPRPRKEPSTVPGGEFLPWIQLHRDGTRVDPFEAARRQVAEQIRDSSKVSRRLDAQIDQWRQGLEPGTDEEVKQLFYRVADRFSDPSTNSFGKDASHALIERDGNPLLVLKAAYDKAGVDSEIYLAKSKFAAPTEYPAGEFDKYRAALMKVQMPGGDSVWLSPAGPDAMFGAIGLAAVGQPAVCVSCEEGSVETVPADGHRRATRAVDVSGELDADGTLRGEMTMTYNGVRAFVVRSNLRDRADRSNRRKYIDLMVSNLLSGASLQSWDIVGEDEPDEPLVITAAFERPGFARRTDPGVLQVERTLFEEPIASSYAELSRRVTPMMVRYQRDHEYSFHVKLPEGFTTELRGQSGNMPVDPQTGSESSQTRSQASKWGRFERTADVTDGLLTVSASVDLPIQRIPPQEYGEFRRWAIAAERSSLLFLTLTRR